MGWTRFPLSLPYTARKLLDGIVANRYLHPKTLIDPEAIYTGFVDHDIHRCFRLGHGRRNWKENQTSSSADVRLSVRQDCFCEGSRACFSRKASGAQPPLRTTAGGGSVRNSGLAPHRPASNMVLDQATGISA
jgi:hypothetical protein